MPSSHRSLPSSFRKAVGSGWSEVATGDRLLLSAKTAVAAAIAWQLAPIVPFAEEEYSYYAPLGVLVSMYPTVARSSRSSLQMLAGLLLGIGLGTAGVALAHAGVPGAAAVGFVAGVGMVLAGLAILGPGQSWVPIAALFVLLIGRGSLQEYSVSYLVNVAFGVVVGLAVNLLVFPPLYLVRASRRLSGLRESVADRMREMADALVRAALDAETITGEAAELLATVAVVREEVREADESRRSNPRGRKRSAEDELNYRRLRALEQTVLLVQVVADGLGRLRTDETPREDLAAAIRRVADLVATPPEAEGSEDLLAEAEHAVEALLEALDRKAGARASTVTIDLMIADALRRIVDASRPFVRRRAPEAPE